MSSPIRSSRLVSHVAAACTAALIAFGVYVTADALLTRAVEHLPVQVAEQGNYLPNMGPDWGTQNTNLNRMGQALSDGTLVVLGSSELSSNDLRFVPYRFFPSELKVPTLAYGHALFQSYGILSLLESMSDSLGPNTRLVIMLSPSWFGEEGRLPRSAFAEHVTGPVWDRLWDKPNEREQMQNWVLDNASFGLFWLIANGQVSELKDKLSLWWHDRTRPHADNAPATVVKAPAGSGAAPARQIAWPASARLTRFDWDDMDDEARAVEKKLGSNNPFAVRDENYDTYLKFLSEPAHNWFGDGDPINSQELGDVSRVMALLQKRKVRAYFVLQPLNPNLVLDIERFDATAAAISGMCARYRMGCLDLYGIPFEPGMLRDDQHLAELGWAKADQGIAEFFSR